MSAAPSSAEALHTALGLEPGTAAALLVDTLSAPEADRLHALLEAADAAETADLDAAVDGIVAGLPAPVRGRIRSVLQRGGR